MLKVQCPYCIEDIEIIAGEEIINLLRSGVSDCKCDYCRQVFEIYQGKDKYETRFKPLKGE